LALVGNNTQSGLPNIYFQVADDGAGDVVVIFDYDGGGSRNHEYLPGEVVIADTTMLVRIIGPRTRMGQLRRGAALIRGALHGQRGDTPDGSVVWCEEERAVVQPPWEEDGVIQAARGGYYNLWVTPTPTTE
jgi:hypothetical protein